MEEKDMLKAVNAAKQITNEAKNSVKEIGTPVPTPEETFKRTLPVDVREMENQRTDSFPEFANKKDEWIRWWITMNPNTPRDMMINGYSKAQWIVASDFDTTPEQYEKRFGKSPNGDEYKERSTGSIFDV